MQNVGMLMAALAVVIVGCGGGRAALVVGGISAYLLLTNNQETNVGTILGYPVSNTVMTFGLMAVYGAVCMVVIGVVIRVCSEIVDGLFGKK